MEIHLLTARLRALRLAMARLMLISWTPSQAPAIRPLKTIFGRRRMRGDGEDELAGST
jgi:hypothetical protein